jgi:hypothetical protein
MDLNGPCAAAEPCELDDGICHPRAQPSKLLLLVASADRLARVTGEESHGTVHFVHFTMVA